MHSTTTGVSLESKPDRFGHAARLRVLAADDSPVNLQIAVRMLQKLGCEVDAAEDGFQAIAMHKRARYDMIILDWQMPGLDGPEVAARIRSTEPSVPDGKRLPIIGLTAGLPNDPQLQDVGPDIDELLHKPLRLPVLQDVLARWIPACEAAAPEPQASGAGPAQTDMQSILDYHGSAVAELAPVFIADSRRRIDLLQEAIAGKDAESVMRTVHAFAGSCASLGARRLSLLCIALERHCKQNGLEGCVPLLEPIRAEFGQLEPALSAAASSCISRPDMTAG